MNLLSSDDLSTEQIKKIFSIADSIRDNKNISSFKEHSILALFFEKNSTRTRVSFEAAMDGLDGDAIYIDASTSHTSRGETYTDTGRMLSSYCNFIAARLNKHSDLLDMAKGCTVPLINALTDLEHPTQALVDLYTILQFKKTLKGIKIAFVGDIATNTANSLMLLATKMGAQISLIAPKNYLPDKFYYVKAREYGYVNTFSNIQEGLDGADIIYTDTFVSMGKEQESQNRRAMFKDYIVDEKMLTYAKEDVLVMHCLPAHRGEEISAEVIDGPKSIVWEQAKNKLLLEQAILLFLSIKE